MLLPVNMKYLYIVLLAALLGRHGYAQTPKIDSIFHQIATVQDEETNVCALGDLINQAINEPQDAIPVGQKLLTLAKKKNSVGLEAGAFIILGYAYRIAGNYVRALALSNKAWKITQPSNSPSMMGLARLSIGNIYKDREENEKAIKCYKEALAYGKASSCEYSKVGPLFNLGAVYLNAGQPDSALMYSQRAYEILVSENASSHPGYTNSPLCYVYLNLGLIHSKLKNDVLAISYLGLGMQNALKRSSKRDESMISMGLAEHYQSRGLPDSAAFYATKALRVAQGVIGLVSLKAKPARLLASLYESRNCDSSLKYNKYYREVTELVAGSRVNQQIQLMTFEEDARQLEVDKAKAEAEHQRHQNIEYALLALGISVLLMAYLILSRSFITNIRLIESAGVVSLLLVFEFLNLVMHPYLASLTHHSPIWMLLALVGIAALLVPLHHRLEKWAISNLVAKNKAIRLAAAKKTMEELGG
jgi:tetratricopeptide (TPR) repeat protein